MAFRDEYEAARERIAHLERELEESKEERARLEASLEARVPGSETPSAPHRSARRPMLLAAAFFSAGIVVAIGVRSVARSDPGSVAAVPTASASAAHDDGAPPFEARFVRAAPFDVKASAWRMRVTYSLAQTREAPERAFFVAGSGVYLKASCHDGAQTETDITQVVLPPGLAVGEHATMLGEPFYYRPLNRAPSWCQLEIYSVVPSTSPTTRLQPAGEACVDTGKDPYVVTSGRCVR